jgi:ribosomal-protein-serine acetyltransferase
MPGADLEIVRGDLVLRPWTEDDVPAMREAVVASLEHLRPFMPWVANEPLPDEARRTLVREWTRDREAGGDVVFGMFVGGAIVGGCGLHRRVGPGGLEIGYWVHVAHVRRGYATRAAGALTTHAFTDPEILRVEIHVDRANEPSNGVPLRLGYEPVEDRPVAPEAPASSGIHRIWRMERERWPGDA